MARTSLVLLITFLLFAGFAVMGCGKTVHLRSSSGSSIETPRQGPPPHAPAHGYRHKHQNGVTLVYDSEIDLYVVSGHTGVYFHKDSYYRQHDGGWQLSVQVDGPWKVASSKKLPKGLKNMKKNSGKAKGKKNK